MKTLWQVQTLSVLNAAYTIFFNSMHLAQPDPLPNAALGRSGNIQYFNLSPLQKKNAVQSDGLVYN